MKVADVMSKRVPTCTLNDPLRIAITLMLDTEHSWLPVVSGGNPAYAAVMGRISLRDVSAVALDGKRPLDALMVWQVMETDVPVCRADADVHTAKATMIEACTSRVVVTDDRDRLEGTLSLADLAKVAIGNDPRDGRGTVTGDDVAEVVAAIGRGPNARGARGDEGSG